MLRLISLCVILILHAACSQSNNLLLGRVQATVGAHPVVVTDCYRLTVDPPLRVADANWRFMPCRDADISIRRDQLSVNGRQYGRIGPRDGVLVDHGVVSVQPVAR